MKGRTMKFLFSDLVEEMIKESQYAHLALAHVQSCHICVIYASGSKFMAGCLCNLVTSQ